MEYFGMQNYVKLRDNTFVMDGSGIKIKVVWNETSKRPSQLDCVPHSTSLAILVSLHYYKLNKNIDIENRTTVVSYIIK
jgi:hypothetical protein